MRYGFIGCGNMAGAIVRGCFLKKSVDMADMFIYDADRELQRARVESYGVNGCGSLEALIEAADIILLGVKPDVLRGLLPAVGKAVSGREKTLVSMAAGMFLQDIETLLGVPEIPIIRIMPNLNAQVGACMTAVCGNNHVEPGVYEVIISFFDAIGMTTEIEEKYFPVYTAIAGCSPAYAFLFIDSLAKGAQKLGMNKKKACAIAAQAVLGSAKLLLESESHPWELIDSVCSPGGTTIEGVCTLEAHQFQSALVNAVEASVKKDRALSEG